LVSANATITTGTITTGVIPTLTAGTTTSTAATITSGTITNLASTTGTIATLNSTTGTITNLSATTSTFLGTITGSTNVINIGSGQIYKDASGNVGIGTNSPLVSAGFTSLTLNGTTSGILEIKSNGTQKGAFFNDGSLTRLRSSGTLAFDANNTEAMRIDSSGNVGIGTASPATKLDVNGKIRIGSGNDYQFDPTLLINGESTGSSGYIRFYTNSQERLRIDGSGNLLVGKTSPSTSTIGFQFDLANQKIASGANGGASALFNRNVDDGMIVQIAKDGTVQGDISVAGTTVSYNGGHLARWSQLPSGQRDPAIKKGTVLSNLDAMCEWRDADGNLLPNEQLNKVKISDVEGDSNTAGVFVNWDNDDQDNPYDLNVAMTGDMIIRIAQGTSVNRGDLLMSAGDGTAKPQGDDIIRSKTIAKVTSTNVTCTYEDGSYCVPCVLMAC